MYLYSTLSLLFLTSVQSFSPTNVPSSTTNTKNLSTSTELNALTADDILKRARKAAGVEEEEPEPIFNEVIMNDFQESLLLLEKRVKQGPSALSSMEIQDLE